MKNHTVRRGFVVKLVIVMSMLCKGFVFLAWSKEGGPLHIDWNLSSRRMQTTTDILSSVDDFSDDNVAFSTCLMVRESDVTKLSEWMAYHYFTIPLRYLVVLPDPTIEAPVRHIVQKWNSMIPTITIWSDDNLMDTMNTSSTAFAKIENEEDAQFQTRRENAFHYYCALHMQQVNRGIVSFQQANEFMAMNPELVTNANSLSRHGGSITTLIQHAQSKRFINSTCITTQHVQVHQVAESNSSLLHADHPSFLPAQRLISVHGAYAHDESTTHDGSRGKYFVNVSGIPDLKSLDHSQQDYESGALEFASICPNTNPYAFFRIHEYSDHASAALNETDHNNELDNMENDDDLEQWIHGFVDEVGPETAQWLLQSDGTSVDDTPTSPS